ncbi:Hpt domain-containing protein [Desulfobacter hydrogenophilus]|uniref:Hpt domain-containing protein n=1 Tax=Desulfobacter hydrogenophilus TaxID=2291 RepID=UPI0013D48692|nr:Hpt domain-containing protein [Desulfobacter hydrogenophilus]NDY71085.1 Hpt domain-containing protein [Desulfobacter hydrogenophilus]
MSRIINLFLEETQNQLENLQQAIRDKNADTVYSIAHSLKSSSANPGCYEIISLAQRSGGKRKEKRIDGYAQFVSTDRKRI